MLSAIQTALSGLAALTKQVEVTGHNVANANSEEFKKSNTELSQWRPGECSRRSERRVRRCYSPER
jgi:flagellar basal body rod protein FlgG